MREAGSATLRSGLHLSYVEQGEATGPALLLIPGPTDSWRSYEPVLDRLPDRIRAIAVSARGHGDSDKPATGYAVTDLAGDVVDLLHALDIDRAVLAGHSGSCPVVRRVALDHPELVAGLVLEASPTTLRFGPAVEFVDSVVAALEDPIDPDFVRSFLADTSSDNIAPDVIDTLVDEVLKVPAHVWHQVFAALLDYDDTGELANITAPTLLIWGDGDGIVSRPMQDELVERMPHADLLVYPGAGHTPRWDDPTRFAADVAMFVDRLETNRRDIPGSTA